MLHNILGFGGRMGRLEYFLVSLALGVLVMMLVVALVAGFMPQLGRGERGPMPRGLMIILLGIVLPIYLWFGLAFQAKRFRDMGWNPIYWIPGSIAAWAIAMLLSPFVPGLALIGGLLNLLLGLCLLFWPSQPTGDGDWYSGSSYDGPADRRPEIDRMPASTSRSPATPPAFSPSPSGFGRRRL